MDVGLSDLRRRARFLIIASTSMAVAAFVLACVAAWYRVTAFVIVNGFFVCANVALVAVQLRVLRQLR